MKKSDITAIMLIVTVTMAITYAAVHALLSGQKMSESVTVESIESISAEVHSPEARIFYKGAINPTVKVETGTAAQSQPFNAQAR
jgi:hypothetical protein